MTSVKDSLAPLAETPGLVFHGISFDPSNHTVRTFDLTGFDACPRCGGRLRVIAIVQDPAVVRTLLAHDGRARAPAAPGPAPPAPAAIG